MLAAMFSGRHYIPTDAEGRYFIDRDGTYFGYVQYPQWRASKVIAEANDFKRKISFNVLVFLSLNHVCVAGSCDLLASTPSKHLQRRTDCN